MKKQVKKIYFFPKTKIGRTSFWFFLIAIVLFLIMNFILVGLLGFSGGENVFGDFQSTIIFINGISGMGCVLTSFVLSIISLFKKERSILNFIILLIGLLFLFLLVGEFVFPH
jgi:uncharacterized membrane protein YhaH (DUF805 family)